MRGYDIKNHVLAAFGGAGPQHACAVARSLGISEIFVHRFSGILSAYGMGLADVVVERRTPVSAVYGPDALPGLLAALADLQTEAEAELAAQGFAETHIHSTVFLNLRYQGTDTAVMIPRPDDGDFAGALERVYLMEFGFALEGRDVLVDDLRVRSRGKTTGLSQMTIETSGKPPKPMDRRPVYFEGGFQETDIFILENLRAGQEICGPAIVIHDTSTILIEPDCRAEVTAAGDMAIHVGETASQKPGRSLDPVQLSIFANLFMSIAEQMGRMLQKTAISTNIKERLDFSCALFGPRGQLVANAPHLPVHLGAMSEAVQAQIRLQGAALSPGDVLVSNHPAAGGSHLPDITVITPVFRGRDIIFWVAARGHHADIGGISPGSMPPGSRLLQEEGACITSFKLVRKRPVPGRRHHRAASGPREPGPDARTPEKSRHPEPHRQYLRPQGPGGRQPERHRARSGNGRCLWSERGAGLHDAPPGRGGSGRPVGPAGAFGTSGAGCGGRP